MGAFFTANAQEEIFSVDFSNTDVLEDWYLINADGDAFGWGVNTEGYTETDELGFDAGVAISASYDNNQGPLTPDNSFITQAFTVPEDGATLSYLVGGIDPEYFAEHYAVYVVSNDDFQPIMDGLMADPPTAEVADYLALLVTPIFEETVGAVEATEKTVAISTDYAGQSVRLVFRHYDVTDQFIIVLDDVMVTEGATAGTNDILASKFTVYPNPANNMINIANAENILVNGVVITDLNGRTVKNVSYNGVTEAQINVSDLASGMYMMTVSSDKGTMTKKIVKN